jgi:ABC-type glutathione transport system ATPase component
MNNVIIDARDVTFRYESGLSDAVSHLSLKVYEGEFVAVLGRNGCGKSTLAKLMNALLLPTSGTITVNGIQAANEDECYEVRKSCGMVFQNPDNQIVTTIVEEDCAFGLENLGIEPELIRQRVDEALGGKSFANSMTRSAVLDRAWQRHQSNPDERAADTLAAVVGDEPGVWANPQSDPHKMPAGSDPKTNRADVADFAAALFGGLGQRE